LYYHRQSSAWYKSGDEQGQKQLNFKVRPGASPV
jgi:hypothetical protein